VIMYLCELPAAAYHMWDWKPVVMQINYQYRLSLNDLNELRFEVYV